jgi:hypothetical protein
MCINYVLSSDNLTYIPVDSLGKTRTFNGDKVLTEAVNYMGHTYIKAYTWEDGNPVSETGWIRQ